MKGILIADAGSSKTHWSFLPEDRKGAPIRIQTKGINPAHLDSLEIGNRIREASQAFKQNKIEEIHYFGAGCASPELKDKILSVLEQFFDPKSIWVKSDLEGAGLAIYGEESGVVAILGTGSASGIFKDKGIQSSTPSLGYILGDEGSGVALGKRLLNSIFKGLLPSSIKENFFKQYSLSLTELIRNVYNSKDSAAFIASFSHFLLNNIDQAEIQKLVYEEFENFFYKNIALYKIEDKKKIGFVGSIASLFQDFLKPVFISKGWEIKGILKEPIIALESYFYNR